jgi:hypothetical protein
VITIIINAKNKAPAYTFVVRRSKKIATPLRLQLAQAIQHQNMRLKIGTFQIDMNDGEV